MARNVSAEDGMARGSETVRFAPDSPKLKMLPGANGRYADYTLADVTDLVEGPLSIPALGQQQPGKVRPIGGGEYAMVAGNRRRWAMQWLNEQSGAKPGDPNFFWFEAKVDKINEQEAYIRNVAENFARKNLNLLDVATAIQTFQSFGMEDKQIRAIFATNGKPKSAAWLAQTTKLLTLTASHRKRLVRGNSAFEESTEELPMSDSAAIALADVPEDQRDVVLNTIEEERRQQQIEQLEAEQEQDEKNDENPPAEEAPKGSTRKRAAAAPISEREVRNASRNVTGKGGSRKMKDVIEFLQAGIDDTTATEGSQQLSAKLLAFCKGELAEKRTRAYWDALVKPKAVTVGK